MLYCDTSFVAPIVRTEPTSARVERFLRRQPAGLLAVSEWTRVEFSSLLAREVRMGRLEPAAALKADAQFEAAIARSFVVLLPSTRDFELAKQYLQRYETGLRAGDALHLAIATNHNASTVYSLDAGMVRAGRQLSLPVTTGIRIPLQSRGS